MKFEYAARSANCALYLDADGVCRAFVTNGEDQNVRALAQRCVGAQFVASLDPQAPNMLGREPRVGKSALFARMDGGRISVLRFGPILRFERLAPSRSPLASAPRPINADDTIVDRPRPALA